MEYRSSSRFLCLVLAYCIFASSAYAADQSAKDDVFTKKSDSHKNNIDTNIIHTSHGLSLFDTLKYSKNFKSFSYVNSDAPKGGSIVLSAIGGFDNLNIYNGKGEVAPGGSLMHDRLLEKALDEPGSEYGLIAETVRHSDDFSWVEYDIRPQAQFSDGKPITPEDVIFSLDILKEKGDPLYRFYYANITKAEKVGIRTVRFIFNAKGNRELPLISGQLPILAKHYWENKDFTRVTLDKPVVSGQYLVEMLEPNRTIIYKRNPKYWATDLPVRKGTNNFDKIKFELYRDALVAFEAFKAGEYDYHIEASAKTWTTGYNFNAVKEKKVIQGEFKSLNSKPFQGLVYNFRKPVFQNPALRKALATTIDFEWLNKNLFYNTYAQTDSYFEGSELEASGIPVGKELAVLKSLKHKVPQSVFTKKLEDKPCNDSRSCSRYARKVLQENGYTYQDGQLLDPQKKPISFEILNSSALLERVLLPIMENMKKLGVQVSLRTLDPAQYIRRLNEFDYDMIVGGWGQSASPGNEQREFWSSQAASKNGSRNYAGIHNKAIDELIERLIFSKTRQELVVTTRALDRLLRHQDFAIPMWNAPYERIAYWNKFSMPPHVDTYGAAGNFSFWWFKK